MEIQHTLEKIGLPETTARVYVALLKHGKATARLLAETVGIPRPSVYDHIERLKKEGLAVELEEGNKKFFQADDPKNILKLIQGKVDVLKVEEKKIKETLPALLASARGIEPKIKFYAGSDGFRRVLNDILWYENTEVLFMWPYEEMREVAGREYLKRFTDRRIDQNIAIRLIWSRHGVPPIKIPKEETRLAPKDMRWSMGYILYDDKVAFISSRAESFAFVVTSSDFSELMRAQFEQIWKLSRKS